MKKVKIHFPITSVTKDDIRTAFLGSPRLDEVRQKIRKLDDYDMYKLAGIMANDYLEQLFWSSLRDIFEEMFLGGDSEKE